MLLLDLASHLRREGGVYRRIPLGDSRVARCVLGRAGRTAEDHVPIEEVVRRYADLVPPGVLDDVPPPAPEDVALARLLAEHPPNAGRGLDIGTGVGRGAFVLRPFLDRVAGLDRSIARIRRARNVAATASAFFLPAPPGSGLKELPLDLGQLDRSGVDFLVADACVLPFADDCFDVVCLRAGDGRGPWEDGARVLAEAGRVLAPAGLLAAATSFEVGRGYERLGAAGPFLLYRRPR